jgi:hypothetical protein
VDTSAISFNGYPSCTDGLVCLCYALIKAERVVAVFVVFVVSIAKQIACIYDDCSATGFPCFFSNFEQIITVRPVWMLVKFPPGQIFKCFFKLLPAIHSSLPSCCRKLNTEPAFQLP